MGDLISKDLILNWLKAWCISRDLPLPTVYKSGFKVDVGYPDQKQRYVFPELNDDFFQLSNEIDDTWIYLKFCGSPEDIKHKIPAKWEIQPQGYMMYCFEPMKAIHLELSDDYNLKIQVLNSVFIAQILTDKNKIASEGRLILVDDLAIYDRIVTHEEHRGKGLATILMKELENIAISNGIRKNFLVATLQGKFLYEKLGWKLYTLYTSIVIVP